MRYKIQSNGDLQLLFEYGLEQAVLLFLYRRGAELQFDEDENDNRYALTIRSKTQEAAELAATEERSTEHSTANNRSDEIAFLKLTLKESCAYMDPVNRCCFFERILNERIAHLRAVR